MNSAEKLYCARCVTIAGLLVLAALLVFLVNSYTGLWLADMERELATSLEVVSGNLAGR